MQFSGQAERDVYHFINKYIEVEQMSPLHSEIAEATGYSKKTVQEKITSLLEKGYITRVYGSTRGLSLP